MPHAKTHTLPLEPDLGASCVLSKTLGEVGGCGATNILLPDKSNFFCKLRVRLGRSIRLRSRRKPN